MKISTFVLSCFPILAFAAPTQQSPAASLQKSEAKKFEPFTGKVTANKVRMRTQPDLEGKIIREMDKDELVVASGEQNGFFAIEVPKGMKGYIFRSYVLDNVVEGSKVNVRLEPSLEAPVLTQLQGGQHVEGKISEQNSKWLEIELPRHTRFFVAKDYVLPIGKKELLDALQKRKVDAQQLIESAQEIAQTELQKPFVQVNMDHCVTSFKRIIQNYQDFPESVAKAQEGLKAFQESYMKSKIAYLESQNRHLEAQCIKVEESRDLPVKPLMASIWEEQEERIFSTWKYKHPEKTHKDFYEDELATAIPLTGMLEAYNAQVKNRPGDYILKVGGVPVAFLYSTTLDLQSKIGKQISVIALKRPNNHFAYPAFFAIADSNQ